MEFLEKTKDPIPYFDILPLDWQMDIVPYWPCYEDTARVFTLSEGGEILAGGVVFSNGSPDTQAYRQAAQEWFGSGYSYIAFFFVPEKYRGRGLGSEWLRRLFQHLPDHRFWLAIEEPKLLAFYEKNGFKKTEEVDGQYGKEWVLIQEKNAGPQTSDLSPTVQQL